MADDARLGEGPGVAVEPHLLRRHALDAGDRLVLGSLDGDVEAAGLVLLQRAGHDLGGLVLAEQHLELLHGDVDELLALHRLGVVGPPFDEAGLDGERVLERAVEGEEARVVLPENIVDVVGRLLRHLVVRRRAGHQADDVLAGGEDAHQRGSIIRMASRTSVETNELFDGPSVGPRISSKVALGSSTISVSLYGLPFGFNDGSMP